MRLIDADAFYESYCTSFEGNVPEGEMDRMAYAIASQTTDCTICGHTNCVSDSVCKICGVKYAE